MRSFALYICLFSFLFNAVGSTNAKIYGPNFVKPLFDGLRTSFSLISQQTIDYVAVTQATTANITAHLNAGEPVVVNTLDANPNGSVVFPMFGFPITVVHSVPGASLNLSQSVLVDIFTGRIGWWNHTNLTDLNSGLPEQPIQVVVGSLLNRLAETLSVLANKTISVNDVAPNALSVLQMVCPTVKATPYSIGFAWLGDALAENSQLALVVNKDGFLADPSIGVAPAMSEFFLKQKAAPGTKISPHNMHGQFSWPMLSLLYMVLPPAFKDCEKLVVIQHFLSLVMFQTQNMDFLCEVQGWEPIKSLSTYGSLLGKVYAPQDYRDVLNALECGTKDNIDYYSVGTSSQLATFILKLLAPYSATMDPAIRLLSADMGIQTYLDLMVGDTFQAAGVDMSFTWQPLLKNYPQLLSVPVFMGSVVPWINLPGLSIVLDQPTLVGIFTGEINVWNDAKIQALNPGVSLPTQNISVYAATEGALDGPTIAFKNWLTAGVSSFSWSQVNPTEFVAEGDVNGYVEYYPYSIGYGLGHYIVNASRQVPLLIGSGGQPVIFSSDSLSSCWLSLSDPKCWPLALPLVAVLQQPTDCARQKYSVDFVEWILQRGRGLNQFLVPNLDPNEKMGAAEYCNGRSLIETKPEPQAFSPAVAALSILAAIGMILAGLQAIALGIARKRSELKSASVVFSLLAVIGAFVILIVPALLASQQVTVAGCGTAAWLLCLGFSLCFGSVFAKLFRLYTIFTSRKLVVPRLSNKRLMMIVSAFLVIDVILLIIYHALTPPEPYVYSTLVRNPNDLVTGYSMLTREMCSFHVGSPALSVILIYKCFVALGGAAMAFFIRQVDRRFSATSALGWAYWNMMLTVVIAIIITVQFPSTDNLEVAMTVPMFAGIWIMYVTLCALTLDSNVLLACKDLSQPLRRILNNSGVKKTSNSKDKTPITTGASSTVTENSTSNEQDPDSSTNKRSQSSVIFVVNREMFPSKYDEFDPDLLEKILMELNHQRSAVRRAIEKTNAATQQSSNVVELSDMGERQHRASTNANMRFSSKSRTGLVPTSQEASSGMSPAGTPRAGSLPQALTPESINRTLESSKASKTDS